MHEIVEAVRLAGVVGAGGAGFPAHIKLSAQAQTVIVNLAECEPLLRVDQQLAVREAETLIKGLELALQVTGAKNGVIALKAKYHDVAEILQKNLPHGISLHFIPDIYPAGDEIILVHEVTGKVVPPGEIPLQVGVVVHNAQTLINIAKAVQGLPVIQRALTVTGWVNSPATFRVPLGISLFEVLKLVGGPKGESAAYILGGPVMGSVVTDLHQPVTKTTGGLIVLPEGHPLIERKQQTWENILRQAKSTCLQCSFCTELCPRHVLGHNLSPHLIMRSINYGALSQPVDVLGSLICSECGVCEMFACPVGLSPRRVNAAFKEKLRAAGIKYQGKVLNEDPLHYERSIPTSRLIQRLGLQTFNLSAPWKEDLTVNAAEIMTVDIPLRQHIGVHAVPVVKKGQHVTEGELIADIPQGQLGARIHASITGKISKVTPEQVQIHRDRRKAR